MRITDSGRGARDQWPGYLRRYHQERPGITEVVFEHVHDAAGNDPYDWLLQPLPARPGRTVDIACGSAPLQPRLTSADTYLGVDISTAELAVARRYGRGPIVLADAKRLPVPDSSVDTVVSSMGLMLVEPLTEALREIARVLKPGGQVAALVPATWPIAIRDLRPMLTLVVSLRAIGAMPQHLTPHGLRRKLARVGLVQVDSQRRRFQFPIRSRDDASLAVRAMYTPGRPEHRVNAAIDALSELAGAAQLSLPLLRIIARRPPS